MAPADSKELYVVGLPLANRLWTYGVQLWKAARFQLHQQSRFYSATASAVMRASACPSLLTLTFLDEANNFGTPGNNIDTAWPPSPPSRAGHRGRTRSATQEHRRNRGRRCWSCLCSDFPVSFPMVSLCFQSKQRPHQSAVFLCLEGYYIFLPPGPVPSLSSCPRSTIVCQTRKVRVILVWVLAVSSLRNSSTFARVVGRRKYLVRRNS